MYTVQYYRGFLDLNKLPIYQFYKNQEYIYITYIIKLKNHYLTT